ncbi:hypothetical protein TKK_0008522 [Trichogramma kaykai]
MRKRKVTQGMFSGTRSTDLINTVCNLIYFRIANDLVRDRLALQPEDLYHVHQGDDVWISNRNPVWAAALFQVMNRIGFIFGKTKQMFGPAQGEFLRVYFNDGTADGYTARAIVNLILRPVQNSISLLCQEQLSSISNSLTTLSRRGLSLCSLQALYSDLSAHWSQQRAYPGDDRPFPLPKAVMWASSMEGGMDCAPPHLSMKPDFSNINYPKLDISLPPEIEALPATMSEDWVKHLSIKIGGKYPIRADSLVRQAKFTNYISLIRDVSSLNCYKVLKDEWVEAAKAIRNRPTPQLVSIYDPDWATKMEVDTNPRLVSALAPANRDKLSPIYLAQSFNQRLHSQYGDNNKDNTLLSAVMSFITSSPFKNMNTTMTALGLNQLEALQFIMNYSQDSDHKGSVQAKQFLCRILANKDTFPLELLSDAAFAYLSAFRYEQHPALIIDIVARVKTQLLSLSSVYDQQVVRGPLVPTRALRVSHPPLRSKSSLSLKSSEREHRLYRNLYASREPVFLYTF